MLPKGHQEAVKEYMRMQASITFKPQTQSKDLILADCIKYVACHLFKHHDSLDEDEQVEVNFRNYIQSPL